MTERKDKSFPSFHIIIMTDVIIRRPMRYIPNAVVSITKNSTVSL